MNRRELLQSAGGVFLAGFAAGSVRIGWAAPLPGGTLNPASIPKYQQPLLVPPAMPPVGEISLGGPRKADYYEITARAISSQMLPAPLPATPVWGYGAASMPGTFSSPALTIEAKQNKPVRVKWINGLVDGSGNYLRHLLPIDQTLHWANPPGPADMHGMSQSPYIGPVPLVTHVHGAHVGEESDGYPEAWFLPNARNIPGGYAKVGSWYDKFKAKAQTLFGQAWDAGSSVYQYPNDQRATCLWYHDHTLGMTRANVYAGLAGFYIIRGDGDDFRGLMPEIPMVVQDRAFNADGSLFYPDNRAFFEGLSQAQLQIPFQPTLACAGPSDIPPIWNPEFFGNVMTVNGRAWPYLDVERRQYRFRLLNGCNSRFLILQFERPLPFVQIGSDGGFLRKPLLRDRLLLNPAARVDVIVDFSQLPPGSRIRLLNLGPDEPFGGGMPGMEFEGSDPQTTGEVMEFRVGAAAPVTALSVNQIGAKLPPFANVPAAAKVRKVSINEVDSMTVRVRRVPGGAVAIDCAHGEDFGPAAGLLGTMTPEGMPDIKMWADGVTEVIARNTVEQWEFYNFTMDAHPIHLHQVQFQIVSRQRMAPMDEDDMPKPVILLPGLIAPEPWESGLLDTFIAYPGMVTRIRAVFDLPGRYVWHCHILEHEDNEMMRPLDVV